MAVPAVLGLAALSAVFQKLIEKVVDFFWAASIRRMTIIAAIVTAMYTALTTLLSVVADSVKPLLESLPPEVASIGTMLPSNTLSCISVMISVEVACLGYKLTIKALEMQARMVA